MGSRDGFATLGDMDEVRPDAAGTVPAHTPRLLVSTAPMLMSPPGWVMSAIADAGYTGCELLLGHNPESRDPQLILAYADQLGLDIPVVHGPYMLMLRNVLGSNYRRKTLASLDIAAELGAQTMVAHAPMRWERAARGWLASREVDHEAADRGTRFAMENLFPVAGRTFSAVVTPEDLLAFRHVVFDTSHFAVAGIDLFTAWDTLEDRVVHLHVSDNFGNGRDSHAPLGSGTLPIERFLAHVGSCGYTGTITLELDCRSHLSSRDTLVDFLAGERRKAEALLVGRTLDDLELSGA